MPQLLYNYFSLSKTPHFLPFPLAMPSYTKGKYLTSGFSWTYQSGITEGEKRRIRNYNASLVKLQKVISGLMRPRVIDGFSYSKEELTWA